MAKVKYMSLVKEVRERLGDVVFSQWKGVPYVKEYVKRKEGEVSDLQREVRAAFTKLVADWKGLNGAMHRGWELRAKDLAMTGFNAFIGENVNLQRDGEALRLFVSTGIDGLTSFFASSGAGPGEIAVKFAPLAGDAHLTLFAQRRVDGRASGPFAVHDAGAGPASPVTVSGLEAGAEYFVYGVVTDAPCDEALVSSDSSSAACKAKE